MIKSNLTNDENLEDLKHSLKNIKNSMSESINELFQIVETTVNDEEIKKMLNVISSQEWIAQTVESAKKVSEMINHEWKSRIRRRIISLIFQLVYYSMRNRVGSSIAEQEPFKLKVVGSIPTRPTNE